MKGIHWKIFHTRVSWFRVCSPPCLSLSETVLEMGTAPNQPFIWMGNLAAQTGVKPLWCFVRRRGYRAHFAEEKLTSFLSVKALQSVDSIQKSWRNEIQPVLLRTRLSRQSRSHGCGSIFSSSTYHFSSCLSQVLYRDIWTKQINVLI